jgi:hypothetical protein
LGLSTDKNLPPLEKDLTCLLYNLCVDWGFCLPPVEAQHIVRLKSVTSKGFAHEVLRAVGMNPEYEVQWVRRIAERFVQHFGSNEVAEEERQ